MLKKALRRALIFPALLTIFWFGPVDTAMASNLNGPSASLAEQIRHQLILLPYYGVFDNLAFTIEDQNVVVLTGQVAQSIIKPGAEAAVRSIEGVGKIVNNIEVLPLSRFDNSIRKATFRAVYSQSGFEKYLIQSKLPVKIIVKNGQVTLDGFVQNQLEKTMARLAANSVPGVFSVTDNIKIG